MIRLTFLSGARYDRHLDKMVQVEPNVTELEVTSQATGCLLSLAWSAGKLHERYVAPSIAGDARKWFDRGLIDWVGEDIDAEQRVTPSTDEEFLPRLAAHLRKTTGFGDD